MSASTISTDWFGKPLYGLGADKVQFMTPEMLAFAQTSDGGLRAASDLSGWVEDVVMPDFTERAKMLAPALQPVTRDGRTTYEAPVQTFHFVDGRGDTGSLNFWDGMDYRFTDRASGESVDLGSNLAAARGVIDALNEDQGRFANWAVDQRPAGSDLAWTENASFQPDPKSPLGQLADFVLPILGSLTPLGPIGGAALGSAVSSVAQGRSLQDILLRSALAGGTAFGVGKLAGALGSGGGAAASGKLGAAASGKLGAASSGLADDGIVTVLGSRLPASSIVGGALGSAFNPLANAPRFDPPDLAGAQGVETTFGPELSASAPRLPTGSLSAGPLAGAVLPNVLPSVFGPRPPAVTEDPETTVTAARGGDPTAALAALGGTAGLAALAAAAQQGTATASQSLAAGDGGASSAAGGGIGAKLASLTLAQKLALAGAGLNLLGGLGGTAGSGAASGGPTGPVARNPIFSAPLPQAGALFRSAPPGAAPFSGDWNRYGMDYGQQSFGALQARAPAGAQAPFAAPLPPPPQELPAAQMLGPPAGYIPDPMRFAGGGHVEGPGGPREDAIPALLSDGEYVIDAETVALLGDGSTEKGAQRLDEFRSNVRRHKGEHLARGKFSADAKPPERYLKQGTR